MSNKANQPTKLPNTQTPYYFPQFPPHHNRISHNQSPFDPLHINSLPFYQHYWHYENYCQSLYPFYPHQYNPRNNYWSHMYENCSQSPPVQATSQQSPTMLLSKPNQLIKQQHCQQIRHNPNPVKLRLPRRKYKLSKKHRKNNASYYWSMDENKRYCDFLRVHASLFGMSLSEKKNLRVNVMMSKKVKSRTAQQCHSHHQKMMKKYGSIDSIIEIMSLEREELQRQFQVPKAQDQVRKDQIKQEQRIQPL